MNVIPIFIENTLFMFVLLNPFLLSVYLLQFIRELDAPTFSKVLTRGSLIAGIVFCLFAWGGDAVFSEVLHVRFAAFLIFGGIVFLIIGLQYVFKGTAAVGDLRGNPSNMAGSIAMPFLIGPGTVSASVVIGGRLPSPLLAILSIVTALSLAVIMTIFLKRVHDWVKKRNEALVERYIEIVGRITALFIGTYSIEMLIQGAEILIAAG